MAEPHGLGDEDGDGGGPWPAFVDLLAATTLLFLILFAAVAVPALRGAGEAQGRRNTLDNIEARIQLAEEANPSVVVDLVGDYLRVRIGGDATFPQNRYELSQLRTEGKQILREIGQLLQGGAVLDSIDQIQVVGHTSVEGSDERNWMLAAARAATVSLFLIDSVGIPACRVSALGRSRYYPIDPEGASRGGINPDDRRIELEIRPIVPSDTVQRQRRSSCVDVVTR
jgi:outer membrane protein OmpA-like peptidoglycan-associated protein